MDTRYALMSVTYKYTCGTSGVLSDGTAIIVLLIHAVPERVILEGAPDAPVRIKSNGRARDYFTVSVVLKMASKQFRVQCTTITCVSSCIFWFYSTWEAFTTWFSRR